MKWCGGINGPPRDPVIFDWATCDIPYVRCHCFFGWLLLVGQVNYFWPGDVAAVPRTPLHALHGVGRARPRLPLG